MAVSSGRGGLEGRDIRLENAGQQYCGIYVLPVP